MQQRTNDKLPLAYCRINIVWWLTGSLWDDTSWRCRYGSWRKRKRRWWTPWASRWFPPGTTADHGTDDKAWKEPYTRYLWAFNRMGHFMQKGLKLHQNWIFGKQFFFGRVIHFFWDVLSKTRLTRFIGRISVLVNFRGKLRQNRMQRYFRLVVVLKIYRFLLKRY